MMRAAIAACSVLVLSACSGTPQPDTHEIALKAFVPDDSTRMMWSPSGMRLPLVVSGDTAGTSVHLGPADSAPILLRLEKSGAGEYYDRLLVDRDRNGRFDDGDALETVPNEVRGRIWSSFSTELPIPAVDPGTGQAITYPYWASFWYVHDPEEPAAEPILRMSRGGWMEGEGVIAGQPVRVLLAESEMDGIFDARDQWSIAEADSAERVYGYQASRSIETHNWVGEQAWRIVSVDPSGMRVVLQAGDPGITRAEEARRMDKLAVDRNAARSGRTVAFENDFETAEARARREGRPLFVDFKTVWCGPCFTMDQWVFTADRVVDASSNVVMARVDGDERRDLARRFEISAYPTLLMLAPGGDELGRFVGYLNVDSTALFLREPFHGSDGGPPTD